MRDVKRIIGSGKKLRGSKAPGIGYLYVLVIMFLIIGAGLLLSGGFVPTDPTGNGASSPLGYVPPTLEPYFNPADYGQQKIIMPTGNTDPNGQANLQLRTFTVNVCGQNTAVLFLIDTSASMTDDNKINKAKEALQAFTKNLANTSVIGMITFSAVVTDRVPMDYYKNNKASVAQNIQGLSPEGWTSTRDGFERAKQILSDDITGNKFPGYHYSLILMTDGVPEIPQYPDKPPRQCEKTVPDTLEPGGQRCFSVDQDPRIPTNVAQDIKNLGVQIYTVGVYSQSSSDKLMEPYLVALLQDLASSPTSSHYYSSISGNNLNTIFSNVVSTICGSGPQAIPSPVSAR